MKVEVLHHYDQNHNETSAREVIPKIIGLTNPSSVVDVGCGVAQWLKVFKDYGVTEVLGIDGAHVPKNQILIDENQFIVYDLRQSRQFIPPRKFDLCLSLEVAEHLDPKHADAFIAMLTSLSDTIIFSAAIPNQTGENHLNEQFPEYWEQIFHKHDFIFLDPFREHFWENEKVNWWYRQNMYLVVKKSEAGKFSAKHRKNNYIHPELFKMYIEQNFSLIEQIQKIESGHISLNKIFNILSNKIKNKFLDK